MFQLFISPAGADVMRKILFIFLIIVMLLLSGMTMASTEFSDQQHELKLTNIDTNLPFALNTPEENELDIDKNIIYNKLDDQWLGFSQDFTTTDINIEFRFNSPTILENNEFNDIFVSECSYSGPSGAPVLPHRTLTLTYPPGTEIKSVSFQPYNLASGKATQPVYPMPKPLPVDTEHDIFTNQDEQIPEMDMNIYSINELYPQHWHDYSTGMGLHPLTNERTLFLVIHVYPVKYNPALDQINYITAGKLAVSVIGPDNLDSEGNSKSRSGSNAREAKHDMVIICPDTFKSTLTDFAAHKTQTGVDSRIVTMGDITSGKYFPIQGRDNAEKIKYFIYNAINEWGIIYVLLVGDAERIPTRITHVVESGLNDDEASDLYFADVFDSHNSFCDWDYDADSRFGEYNSGNIDKADLYPDVHIGRFPASTSGEVTTLVSKTKNYEIDAIGQSWFKNAVLCGLDTFSGGTPEGEYLSDHIASNYLEDFNVIKLYESDDTLTKQNIKTNWNSGAGFVSFSDHGLHSSWGNKFSSSDVKSLTNSNKYSFVNFDACLCGEFDQGGSDCIAEEVMLNQNGGGVAVVASSRIAYGSWGRSHINSVSGYLNVRLYHNFDQTTEIAGALLTNAKIDYIRNVGTSSSTNFKTVVEYNYFGDPSLLLGGLPTAIYNLQCSSNTSSITPGASTQYKVEVENTDIQTRQITLSTSTPPKDWIASLSDKSLTLQPGKKVNVTLTINAPVESLAGYEANIKVIGALANSERTICVFTKTKINRIYGLNILSDEDRNVTGASYPGSALNFSLEIMNLGNAEDQISLEFISQQDEGKFWNYFFTSELITLPAFSLEEINLKISIPAQVIADDYSFKVRGKLISNSNTKTFDVFIQVKRTYGVNISCTNPNLATDPDNELTYNILLENFGNHLESFNFILDNLHNDWYVRYLYDSEEIDNNTIQVLPYDSMEIKCVVFIPQGTLVGDYLLTLYAECVGQELTIYSNIDLNAKVNRVYGVLLTSIQDEYFVDIGEELYSYFQVANLGNYRDFVDIVVVNEPKNWNTVLDKDLDILLYANDQEDIGIKFTPVEKTKVGSYIIELLARIAGDNSTARLQLNVNINRNSGLNISNAEPETLYKAGQNAELKVSLENLGNDVDYATLSVPDRGPHCNITFDDASDIKLIAFESAERSLTLEFDDYAIAGTHIIPIIGRLKSTGENYSFNLEIKVKSEPGIDLTLGKSIIEIQPGDDFDIEITILNRGNIKDNFTLEIHGIPNSWEKGFLSQQTVFLMPYSSKTILLSQQVPTDEPYHEIEIDIQIRSKTDSQVKKMVPLSVSIKEEKTTIMGLSSESFSLMIIIVIAILVIIISLALIRSKRKKNSEGSGHGRDNVIEYNLGSDGSRVNWDEPKEVIPAQYNPPTPAAYGQDFEIQVSKPTTYRSRTNFGSPQIGQEQYQRSGDYADAVVVPVESKTISQPDDYYSPQESQELNYRTPETPQSQPLVNFVEEPDHFETEIEGEGECEGEGGKIITEPDQSMRSAPEHPALTSGDYSKDGMENGYKLKDIDYDSNEQSIDMDIDIDIETTLIEDSEFVEREISPQDCMEYHQGSDLSFNYKLPTSATKPMKKSEVIESENKAEPIKTVNGSNIEEEVKIFKIEDDIAWKRPKNKKNK